MTWFERIGRGLITLGCLGMALLAVYFAWVTGAFDKTDIFGAVIPLADRLLGWWFLLAALALTVLGGCMFLVPVGRMVLGAIGLVTVTAVSYLVIVGWGDDLLAVAAPYALIGVGYGLVWGIRRKPVPSDKPVPEAAE